MFRISTSLEAAAKEASVKIAELGQKNGRFSFGGAPYALIAVGEPEAPGIPRGIIESPVDGEKFNLFLLENGKEQA